MQVKFIPCYCDRKIKVIGNKLHQVLVCYLVSFHCVNMFFMSENIDGPQTLSKTALFLGNIPTPLAITLQSHSISCPIFLCAIKFSKGAIDSHQ